MSDDHGHGDEPFLAHHFEDQDHQFDSGKLGIWAFLVTEVLFFSGLFCAYAIYRSMHPEVFTYASQALDTKWGAINTAVLIFSSLTAAWAVRNAQLGQQRMLCVNLVVTIACAFGFMGVKYVEYSHKFHLGIFPGNDFKPHEGSFSHDAQAEHVAFVVPEDAESEDAVSVDAVSVAAVQEGEHGGEEAGGEQESSPAPAGATEEHADSPASDDGHEAVPLWNDPKVSKAQEEQLAIFFGIYYCMTGLHGIHVLLGIVVLTWLLTRAIRGHFTPTYYGPIDFAALYWHLVDLIWIYLFPLLYLIN